MKIKRRKVLNPQLLFNKHVIPKTAYQCVNLNFGLLISYCMKIHLPLSTLMCKANAVRTFLFDITFLSHKVHGMGRLPSWIRLSLTTDQSFNRVNGLISDLSLHTVCESAKCPNRHECWNSGTATLMLLGDVCTRNCTFCAIKAGRPQGLDEDEPRRVALAARNMDLRHAVLTSVARDDLEDGGAGIFAETINAIRSELPDATIEVLTPDFEGDEDSLATVCEARPDVFNHNLETVSRLQPVIRPQASYGRSLAVLEYVGSRYPGIAVKSGLMLGMGETEEELYKAMRDLVNAGCRILTLGQYLQPSRHHPPVKRYPEPGEFDAYAEKAREFGFIAVMSGPMVRSSYKADELLQAVRDAKAETVSG